MTASAYPDRRQSRMPVTMEQEVSARWLDVEIANGTGQMLQKNSRSRSCLQAVVRPARGQIWKPSVAEFT